MGLMTSMRNRSMLLLGIICFAILAFLVSDAIRSGTPFLQDAQNKVGSVAGTSISIKDFQGKLDVATENFKAQSKNNNLNAQMQGYLVDQTWNQAVADIIFNKEYEKLGIDVGNDELFDMIQGKNPHPEVRKAFTNPQTGVFDPTQVITFLKTMDERDPTGATRKQWLAFEKGIRDERIRQKYLNLVKNGLYVTSMEAKANYEDNSKSADINYILLDYQTIPDSTIKLSETDVKNYYEKNKFKYKQKEEERSIEYIVFDVTPSAADTISARKDIEKLSEGFATTANDSLYVSLNADTKSDLVFTKKGSLSPIIDSIMFSAPVGFIYGPYMENNAFKISKLMKVKSEPDSVKARHILIKTQNGNNAAAKAKLDSLKKLVQAGTDFAQLAIINSEDDGSKIKGGDLGFFGQGAMVKNFSDASFGGSVGDLPIVETEFGVHLIQIMAQKGSNRVAMVGTVDRLFEPSSQTQSTNYGKANEFLSSLGDGKDFEAQITKANYNKRMAENIKPNDQQIAGLDNPREIIKWAFGADKADLSPLFEIGNKYIVARVSQIKEKGYVAIDAIKTEVENAARIDKKGEMLIEKLNTAKSAGALNQIAQKVGSTVLPSTGILFGNGILPGVAREPMLVGEIFGSEKNKIAGPVRGERGVYLFTVTNFSVPTPTKDYSANKLQLLNQEKQGADGGVFEALKQKADITDNRIRFY